MRRSLTFLALSLVGSLGTLLGEYLTRGQTIDPATAQQPGAHAPATATRSQEVNREGAEWTLLRVSVVAAQSGAPLRGVSLTIRPRNRPGPLFAWARSDSDGVAYLPAPAQQDLTLIAFPRPRRHDLGTLEVNGLFTGEQREVVLELRASPEAP